MTKKFLLLTVLFLVLPGSTIAQQPPGWRAVAERAGAAAWNDVDVLQFTWTHVSGKSRQYVWNVPDREVTVTEAGTSVTIPTSGAGLDTPEKTAAHKAFVNDSYWLLFDLHSLWDRAQKSELGVVDSPFGSLPAYRVAYGPDGGYTPGDHYVVYIGEGAQPVGWSYFPGGAAEPKLSTTRERYQRAGPLHLPTLFRKPSGEKFIEISGLSVTQ